LSEKQCELKELGPCSCYIKKNGQTKIIVCDPDKFCTDQMCSATSPDEIISAFVIMFGITCVLVIFLCVCIWHKKVKKCVRCLLCSFLASKKSYEEQLEGNKIYSIYLNVFENPYATSKNPRFTNAQLALQTDLYDGKVEWTGDFWQDYKYFIWMKHPLVSMFRYNPLDLFEVNDRASIFYMTLLFSFFFAFYTSQEQASCVQLEEDVCWRGYLWAAGGVVFLSTFQFIAKKMATCSCMRNCGARMFDCTKLFGQFGLLTFSLFCLCVLIYTMILATRAKSFVSFFMNLGIQNLTAWFQGFYRSIYSFYSARKESKEDRDKLLEKSKTGDDKNKKQGKYRSNKTVPKAVADEDVKALPAGIYQVDITETLEKITFTFPERGVLFKLSILFPIFVCLNDTNDYTFQLKKPKLEEQQEGEQKAKLEMQQEGDIQNKAGL